MRTKNINKLFLKKYGWVEDELNRWCHKVDMSPDGLFEGYQINPYSTGITVAAPTAEAFTLNDPTGPAFIPDPNVSTTARTILIRTFIPKAAVIDFQRNDGDLLPWISACIERVKQQLGYGPNTPTAGKCYATFSLPWSETPLFLRERENGDYELRLYSMHYRLMRT